MKLTIILAACSVGLVLGSPVGGADEDPAPSCYNRDDARRDARAAGCNTVDPDSNAGTSCDLFGCNCMWGCLAHLDGGGQEFSKGSCPPYLGVSKWPTLHSKTRYT